MSIPSYSSARIMQYIFTAVFSILNFALSFIGSRVLRRRVQHHLTVQRNDPNNKASTVPINYLTPWLTVGDFLMYYWQIRKVPGGIYGALMLGTAIFGLAVHYFVIGFIHSVQFGKTCDFSEGLNSLNFKSGFVAAPTWYGAQLVNNAFDWANYNDCPIGIFEKVPYPTYYAQIQNFCPREDDIIGRWNCTDKPGITMSPSNLTTSDVTIKYIKQQAFLYSDVSVYESSVLADGEQQGFIYWSANQPSNSSKQWDVRAVIFDNTTSSMTTNFQCSATNTSHWALPLMDSNRTLHEWNAYMYGQFYGYDNSTYKQNLEQVLNTMSILSGSGNAWKLNIISGQQGQYGCLVDDYEIDNEIFIMLSVLVFLLLLVLGVDIYALACYKLGRTSKIDDELSYVPTDLLSWQLAMVKRSTGNDHLTKKDMGTISYAYVKRDNQMRSELGFVETKRLTSSAHLLPVSESREEVELIQYTTKMDKLSSTSL